MEEICRPDDKLFPPQPLLPTYDWKAKRVGQHQSAESQKKGGRREKEK